MKIAFVGKGGSGKSTVAGLFTQYLLSKNKEVLSIDADINMHFADHIGATINPDHALSHENNIAEMKKYIKGNNKRILDPNNIVKTTPPSKESNFLTVEHDNYLIQKLATPFSKNGFFMYVGTYTEEGIGDSCYHTSLAPLESLLSHTLTTDKTWVVVDMVAGTDAFAGSLHAQFDLLVLVLEPTLEGVSVWDQYQELAKTAGVADFLIALGNKVDGPEDESYLRENVGDTLVGFISLNKTIKNTRRDKKPLEIKHIPEIMDVFLKIEKKAQENFTRQDDRLKILHSLHRKHAQADYIKNRHGDVSQQIDPQFSYNKIP